MDSSLIHADTFFFVSTILLSALSVVFIIALLYVVYILREIRRILKLTRVTAENLSSDLRSARDKILAQEFFTGGIVQFIANFLKKKKEKSRKINKKKSA